MTDLLFHHDSYLREFEAVVINAVENSIELDRTAFYPGGGGQPYDVGTLVAGGLEYPVTRVGNSGGKVMHQIDGPVPRAGTAVSGRVELGNAATS